MLSQDQVRKVALLARLELTDAELQTLTSQLGQIVDYVQQLEEVDTDRVEPLAHAADLVNVFREDTDRPSLTRDQALQNAPKRDEECFRVPAVLGE